MAYKRDRARLKSLIKQTQKQIDWKHNDDLDHSIESAMVDIWKRDLWKLEVDNNLEPTKWSVP